MANASRCFLSLCVLIICSFVSPGVSISGCDERCRTLNDCDGQLICIGGKCTDDPDVGTHICRQKPSPSPSPSLPCKSTGHIFCKGKDNPTYPCSPPVKSSNPAILTWNGFEEGEEGGDPSECDGKFHSDNERVVALSTGWYDKGSRCGRMIRITTKNGKSTTAKVVDECDSMNGCDKEHGGEPPCRPNVVDGSLAVWKALGLDTDEGEVDVTWSMN